MVFDNAPFSVCLVHSKPDICWDLGEVLGKRTCECESSSQREEVAHVWLSSEVKILLFFCLGPLGAQIYVRLVLLPPERFALADALAADCCSVIHQLGSLSVAICAEWQRAWSDTASYGGPEIGAVLMMSLRFWGQAFCPFFFRLLPR